jgi:hypothetical protein
VVLFYTCVTFKAFYLDSELQNGGAHLPELSVLNLEIFVVFPC